MTKQIHLIAAARPNFMKIAPLYHALVKEEWAKPVIVHSEVMEKNTKAPPLFWDGKTAERVFETIKAIAD